MTAEHLPFPRARIAGVNPQLGALTLIPTVHSNWN